MRRAEDGERLHRRCHRQGPHHHLVCRVCGTTVDLPTTGLEHRAARHGQAHGFTRTSTTVELHGLCPSCSTGPGPSRSWPPGAEQLGRTPGETAVPPAPGPRRGHAPTHVPAITVVVTAAHVEGGAAERLLQCVDGGADGTVHALPSRETTPTGPG